MFLGLTFLDSFFLNKPDMLNFSKNVFRGFHCTSEMYNTKPDVIPNTSPAVYIVLISIRIDKSMASYASTAPHTKQLPFHLLHIGIPLPVFRLSFEGHEAKSQVGGYLDNRQICNIY